MGANTAQGAVPTVEQPLVEQNQADKALTNGDGSCQNVVENSVVGVAVADLTGRFLAANPAYKHILGYTDEELEGLSFLGLADEKNRANETLIQELLDGKRQQFQIEKCYRNKDGNRTWTRNRVFLVPSADKAVRSL